MDFGLKGLIEHRQLRIFVLSDKSLPYCIASTCCCCCRYVSYTLVVKMTGTGVPVSSCDVLSL